ARPHREADRDPALSHGALRRVREEARGDAGGRRQHPRPLAVPLRLEHEQQQRARQLSAALDPDRRRERRPPRQQERCAARAHAAREPASHDPRQAGHPAGELRRQHRHAVRRLTRGLRMDHSRNAGRRRFLRAGLESLASLPLLGLAARFAHAQAATSTARRLTERITLVSGVPGNVLALAADGGFLLVDTGSAEYTQALVEALGDAAVHTVINTHYHADQTGGNMHFGEAGATIHAHEITRQWLSSDYYVPAEDRW